MASDRATGGRINCFLSASAGEPLAAPAHILALSLSAIAGGAVALRLEGSQNIAAVRQSRDLPGKCPIIGLSKSASIAAQDRLNKVYITSTYKEAAALSHAGADIIALDATDRERADGMSLCEMIASIHKQLHKPVWADIATFKEAIAAFEAGADLISTTLWGYTQETVQPSSAGPALDLLKALVNELKVPIVLEGRIWHPQEVTQAFEAGAYAVVVGSAITRPKLITERFVKAIPSKR